MTTWVALLRGINVGGARKVPMADLRHVLSGAGMVDVETYIASGNVVLDAEETDGDELARRVAAVVADRFGFDVGVVARTADEVEAVVTADPWGGAGDPKRIAVAFLSAEPDPGTVAGFDRERYLPDEMTVIGAEAHLRYPNGQGRANLTHDRLERELGVSATVRNWNTVARLAEMCVARL